MVERVKQKTSDNGVVPTNGKRPVRIAAGWGVSANFVPGEKLVLTGIPDIAHANGTNEAEAVSEEREFPPGPLTPGQRRWATKENPLRGLSAREKRKLLNGDS